ncbi:MAG: hypothetical protein Q8928_03590 [Bacteroidota bacterium]|nr:hypothetical protein [Bacteroidota bacterium]
MSILYNFRLKFGRYKLKKELRKFKRIREAKNFETAASAAILFTPADIQGFELIREFMGYLSGYNIKVSVLGYVDSKVIPEDFLFRKDIELFSQNDLKWDLTPISSHVFNFIERPFDLFFDLSTKDFFPNEYVACLSKAKFKVSRSSDEQSFDLMFSVDKDMALEAYLENIKKYMSLIKPPPIVKELPRPTSWTLF